MHDILRHYLKKLTNLSGSNRSLLLLRLISDQTIDLHDFDFILNQSSFSIIESLIAQKKKIPLAAISDPRMEANNVLSKKLKKLQRIEKFIYDERGGKDLYVGWPFVRGKFQGGTTVRCPLIFFPVEIVQENDQWVLQLREEVNITFNKTFLLAYAYYHQIKLDDELVEKVFEIFDADSRVFRTELYQIFKESAVNINFNQDNFVDKLQTFKNFKKADFDESEKEGELKLFPEAVLGIFPQSGSYLVPDYTFLLEQEEQVQDIEEFFISRNPDKAAFSTAYRHNYRFLDYVKEEETFTSFPLDAYQENALKAVKKGNSLVVQGPPGTGKSQLISNLVTDFIARGKRVLVVCQKRAALDVIYQRLKEIEMDAFAALVHDFKNDRKKIFEQIQHQIDRIDEYEARNNGLDSVQIQRDFLKASRRIDQLVEEREDYRLAFFDEEECGISAKELYLNTDPKADHINLKQVYRHFKREEINDFSERLFNYQSYADDFLREGFSWRERTNFKDYTLNDKLAIEKLLAEIPKFLEGLGEEANQLVGSKMSIKEFEDVQEHEDKLRSLNEVLNERSFKYLSHMIAYKDENTNALWLSNIQRLINNCFAEEGVESTLNVKELGELQKILNKRKRANQQPSQWIKWVLFAKEKQYLKNVAEANGVKTNKAGIKKLERLLDNRLNLEHNVTKIRNQKWLIDYPKKLDQELINDWFAHQLDAIKAKEILNSFTNFKEFSLFKEQQLSSLLEKIKRIIQLAHKLVDEKSDWRKYLTRTQIDHLEQNGLTDAYLKTFQESFDELVDFDQLFESFSDHEKEVIKLFKESDIDYSSKNIRALFTNGIYLSWLDHIETKYPILRDVSTRKFQQQTDELQRVIEEKEALSKSILTLKVREKTFEDVDYNRLNNRVTYRDLSHQVTKKRQIWPIRKVIQTFTDEVFNLMPCWLASPESVSAIFPMEQFFDLVVFDEASQCFVEKGIPAMYRGRQVVIAGDSKQLSPNDLYKVRWEEEEANHPDFEIDSLLDLANKYLMDVQLNGHYRSKSLDLINFSNKHFYDGKLNLLPDFNYINSAEPGIEYIKVPGVWEKQTNLIEAKNVVDLIKQYLKDTPDKEIGVVTFNAPQQNLIWDLLEEQLSLGHLRLPDNFFVKNIENVQGDEKDIIIFSTAYAPDANGRMNMNFGSINAPKGENRLNVAITRAREKVILVSSIYPDELKVDDAKNEGPRLLKAYLKYALSVSNGDFKPEPMQLEQFRNTWFLKKKLPIDIEESTETTAKEELPFADLSIKENEKYRGLVYTDDDLYFANPSVKDIYAYTPNLLQQKNWPFIMVNSRNYWKDKEEMLERIIQFIQRN
ncbi:AAA domain-containing protein [Marivirga atlantica]|jgi:energy-coupling factor transporter ATP-binding protein EcfA2|uniref:DUF4011 domain-containing protein n=1 Tax=Marivirga atlantica TaxID=1548457 RepID=A0A937DHT4_9BACT|nr:AAA domain-containing protein [Marivirga atlantica]MBL0764330.1 DUF4011 domain-containing protein [Marivirga atlantica]